MVQPPDQGTNSPDDISLVEWDLSQSVIGCLQRQGTHPFLCLPGLTLLLLAPALKVSTPTPRLTLQLGETQRSRVEGLHAFPLGSDIPLQQAVLLQQVLSLHQVLPTLPGQQLSLQEGAALSSFLALALRSLPAPHRASPLLPYTVV